MTEPVNTPKSTDAGGARPGRGWCRVAGTLTRRTPRSLVLLAPGSNEAIRLEAGAVAIWDALDAACDETAVIEQLAERTGFDPHECAPLVDAVIGDLARIDAIEGC